MGKGNRQRNWWLFVIVLGVNCDIDIKAQAKVNEGSSKCIVSELLVYIFSGSFQP